MDQRISRRRLGQLGAASLSLAAMGALVRPVSADQTIQSTKQGDVPTTGGLRPGPFGLAPTPLLAKGVKPVAIEIDVAQVNAQVETIAIVNGVMQDPTGPWVVSWYKETAQIGQVGNAVMAGHLDYWDVGPAVFYHIGALKKNDPIVVTGADNNIYTYKVDTLTNYDVDNAPIEQIVGPTTTEVLTLITCGGPFDYSTGHYLQRTVVRAHRAS